MDITSTLQDLILKFDLRRGLGYIDAPNESAIELMLVLFHGGAEFKKGL